MKMKLLKKILIILIPLCLFVNMVVFSNIENDYNEHNETFANKIDSEYHVIKLKDAIKYDDCILDARAVNIYYADENGIWIDFYGIDDNENSVDKWNMALVGYDGSIRYYNKNDDLLNGLFYDGIARVKIDDKYGYINESYNWVVPPIYNFATIFKDGMGFASKENNYGEIENFFFDNTGNVIFSTKGDFVKYHSSIATEYDKEENYEVFSNGYAEYNLNGKKYIIDKDLVPCQKNKIELPDSGELIGYDSKSSIKVYTFLSNQNDKFDKINAYMYGRDNELKYTNTFIIEHGTYYKNFRILDSGMVLFDGYLNENQNNTGFIELVSPDGQVIGSKELKQYIQGNNLYDKCFSYGENLLRLENVFYNRNLTEIGEILLYENGTDDESTVSEFIGGNNNIVCCFTGHTKLKQNNTVYYVGELNTIFVLNHKTVKLNNSPKFVNQDKIPQYENSNEIKIYLNNEQLKFDITPITEKDRTLVPMRAIFEALGAEVEWENETRTATATKNGITVSVTIDSNKMQKNGEDIELDVPARLVGDSRTLVPLRAISEAFGCQVEWDEELQRVDIYSN